MKKIKIYISLFIYIISCLGIIVNFHYCAGKLVTVNLFYANEDNCCGEEQEKSDDCCKDKLVLIETNDTESITIFTFQSKDYSKSLIPICATNLYKCNNVLDNNFSSFKHAPPNKKSNSLLIKNSVMRI